MEISSRELENKKKVVHKFLENPNASGASIAKSLNLNQRTVRRIIKRFRDSPSVSRASDGGRKPGSADKNLAQKIIRPIKQNPGLSDNDRAKKYGTSPATVRRTRIKAGYKSYRMIKHPNRSEKQSLVAKKRARLLHDKVLTKDGGCILMDDETYVKCDYKQLPGRKFYTSTFRGNVPSKYKYVMHDKYAKKLMIGRRFVDAVRRAMCS